MRTKRPAVTSNVGNKDGVLPIGTTVWKALKIERPSTSTWGGKSYEAVIAKLVVAANGLVPDCAKKNFLGKYQSRKCRVPSVLTIDIYDRNGNKYETAFAGYDFSFTYTVGQLSTARNWDPGSLQCSGGVHCFRTEVEAKQYAGWL